MSDLDDDLLALAGGVSDSENDPKVSGDKREAGDAVGGKAKKRHIQSDGNLDEEDMDDGNEEDDGNDADYGDYDDGDADLQDASDEVDDNDDLEEDEEELVNPYPLEGKYKDEEDREKLLSMDEIQREQTLFERTQEMERYNEKKYLQQRMQQEKQKKHDSSEKKATRASTRNKEASGRKSKLDKLTELKKQRERKSRMQQDDYEEESEEEDEDEHRFSGDDDEDGYGYGYDDEDEDVAWGRGGSSKFKRKSFERAKLEDIQKILVGRSILHKYCYYSDFSDAVIGCFGRVNIGIDRRTKRPMYRLVTITDVKSIPEKAYDLPKFKCDIYLTVNQNREQSKTFPINIFSDSPLTSEELERYVHELNKTGEELPYLDDVNEKYEILQHMLNRGISDKDINEIMEKKQKLLSNIQSYDAVYKKARLLDQLKIAEQTNDEQKATEVAKKISELEKVLISKNMSGNNSESLSTMSKVNERNRKLNHESIRKAEVKSSQARKVLESGGGDPFSRLKTLAKTMYEDINNQENEKALVNAKSNFETRVAEKNRKEAEMATSTYRCLGIMDKLIKEIDVYPELKF